MKIKPSFIPAYEIYEYRIILQPHEDLCNKINAIKRSFAEMYQLPVYRYAKPDITLVRFKQYEMVEEKIMHRLQNIAISNTSFAIELKDYGSFPTHSIFINVATKTLLRPTLSPRWPNTMPPSGLVTKPAAKVAYDNINETVGSSDGKYNLFNTTPAITPNKKKSYHSIVAPIRLDMTV